MLLPQAPSRPPTVTATGFQHFLTTKTAAAPELRSSLKNDFKCCRRHRHHFQPFQRFLIQQGLQQQNLDRLSLKKGFEFCCRRRSATSFIQL